MITTSNNNNSAAVTVPKFVAVALATVEATQAQGRGISLDKALKLVIGKGKGKRAERQEYIRSHQDKLRTIALAEVSEAHNEGFVRDMLWTSKDGNVKKLTLRRMSSDSKAIRYNSAQVAQIKADLVARMQTKFGRKLSEQEIKELTA